MKKDEDEFSMQALLREYELYAHPSSEKQKDILAAAEKLFSELGYERTPTAEIAKKAGVTERTLFKHFPTKSSLWHRILSAVVLRAILPHQLKKVKQIMARPWTSYEEFFMTITRDRLQHVQSNAEQLRMVVHELMSNDCFRAQFSKLWQQHVWKEAIKALEKLQKEGKIRADVDVRRLARANTLLTSGYLFLSNILAPDLDWDHEAELKHLFTITSKGVL